MTTRRCISCGQKLPLTTEYYYRRGDTRCGFHSTCKICKKVQRVSLHERKAIEIRRQNDLGQIPTTADLAEMLRNARREGDLTQTAAGRLIGVAGNCVGQLEVGYGLGIVERVFLLMGAYGYNVKLVKKRKRGN